MIKLIATDLDGTLLNDNKKLSRFNRETLIEAQRQGYIVALATGRNFHSMDQIITDLKMDQFKSGYIVGINGMQIYDFKRDKYQKAAGIGVDAVARIQNLMAKNNCLSFYFSDQGVFCLYSRMMVPFFKNGLVRRVINRHVAASNHIEVSFESNRYCFQTSQDKICFIVFNQKKLRRISEALGNDFRILKVGRRWVEIIPKKVSKSIRLKEIMEIEGVAPEELIVFGDSENDVDMLGLTANSYAVANGLPQVRKVANNIISSNNDDGVGKEIKRIISKG